MPQNNWVRYFGAVIIFFYSATGCTVYTVDLSPDPIHVGGDAFNESTPDGQPYQGAWWESFNDDVLDGLIYSALADNLDILTSRARLRQSSALARLAQTSRYPAIDLTAQTDQIWRDGGDREEYTRAGVLFSWEVDVFSRLQSAALARRYEELASREFVETVRLRLSAEVAGAYFDAVAQRNQLVLLSKQIGVDEELLDLTELRYESGLTSSVDMLQQSSQLAETQSLVPAVESALRVAENRLDVLLGMPPDGVDRVSSDSGFASLEALPFVGVPADLLLNRPDIRALRNELVAADAEISRAIADRLPQFILDGSLLYERGIDPGGVAAALFGSFFQPLIDWGARKAEVERNRALYVERLGLFSQRYLEAIEDVENALYQEKKQREFLERLQLRRRFLERTVAETTDRYTNGLTDYLPVLDAVKELQRLERVLVLQERALLGFRLQLHRALGGALPPFSPEDVPLEVKKR